MTNKSGLGAIIALVILAPANGQNTPADLCNDAALNVKTLPALPRFQRDLEHKSSFLPPLLFGVLLAVAAVGQY